MSAAKVVYKTLDEDCLLGGQLHPMVRDRLGRVRELAHLGVANLLGVERREGRAVLVWEHVEGQTLADYLSGGPIDEGRRRSMARELVSHVQAMHALGIVHGAIHARNVIVTPSGGLKLTHVSPLLYTETEADAEALGALLEEMGLGEVVEGAEGDVREMARRLGNSGLAEEAGRHGPAADRGALVARRLALAGAAAAALAGAMVAWMFWRIAESPAEPGGGR